MKKKIFKLMILSGFAIFLLNSCDSDDDSNIVPDDPISEPNDPDSEPDDEIVIVGGVYTITNESSSNAVTIYSVDEDGQLRLVGNLDADGTGSGARTDIPIGRDPLTSQDAVILNGSDDVLYVVNAGSNSISAFSITNFTELSLIGTYESGGTFPVALAIDPSDSYLYVLNTGGAGTDNLPDIIDDGTTGNVSGFSIGSDGSLTPIADSIKPLSGEASEKGTLDFSPDGNILAAIEFGDVSNIVSYVVADDGSIGDPNVFNTEAGPFEAAGDDPFGAEFDSNGFFHTANLELTPPPMALPEDGGSSNSVYSFDSDGNLTIVEGAIVTGQIAGCWMQLTLDEEYVYSINTDSRTITGFAVGSDGQLTPLEDDFVTLIVGPQEVPVATENALDLLDITITEEYMYGILPITNEVRVYRIEEGGALTFVPELGAEGVGVLAQGIAATGDDGS